MGPRSGKKPAGEGIDDVWAADLDGDGIDEVIVGYNGGAACMFFAADGKRLWKRTDLANVWHVNSVCAASSGRGACAMDRAGCSRCL